MDSDPTSRNSFYQCVCQAGMGSYCSRVVNITTTVVPSSSPTWTSDASDPIGGPRNGDPEWSEPGRIDWANLEGGVLWLGILSLLVCLMCAALRCECEEGAETETGGEQRRRSSVR